MANNIIIDTDIQRSLAKASGVCGAFMGVPLLLPKLHDSAWLPGILLGFIFGWGLGMAHKGLATVIVLSTALYYAVQLGVFSH